MGWSVHVNPITHFTAVCTDDLACPGPREDGQWTGPLRDSQEDADRDAREHYRLHDTLWLNEAWDADSDPAPADR